jgi:hypothetical protein
MGGGCVARVGKIHPVFLHTKVQVKYPLEDQSIDERIRLKWILKLTGA